MIVPLSRVHMSSSPIVPRPLTRSKSRGAFHYEAARHQDVLLIGIVSSEEEHDHHPICDVTRELLGEEVGDELMDEDSSDLEGSVLSHEG